jgi:hypothetical protein
MEEINWKKCVERMRSERVPKESENTVHRKKTLGIEMPNQAIWA